MISYYVILGKCLICRLLQLIKVGVKPTIYHYLPERYLTWRTVARTLLSKMPCSVNS